MVRGKRQAGGMASLAGLRQPAPDHSGFGATMVVPRSPGEFFDGNWQARAAHTRCPHAFLRDDPRRLCRSSSTLHIAFADAIDYPVLYAIEKMTGCHTEACMALPEVVQCRLQEVSERRMEFEVVFECEMDIAGFARTVRSYCGRLEPTEVRVTAGGRYSWICLLWKYRPPVDLLARLPESGNVRLTSKASPWAADMNSGG